jgi:hypothetical protein
MTEEKKEKWGIHNLKGFEKGIETFEKFLPKGFDFDEKGILMDYNRIIAVYPKQELPKEARELFKISKYFPFDQIKEVLKLFKKGEVMTFHFAKKDYPMLIESERFLAAIAPRVNEIDEEEDDEW